MTAADLEFLLSVVLPLYLLALLAGRRSKRRKAARHSAFEEVQERYLLIARCEALVEQAKRDERHRA